MEGDGNHLQGISRPVVYESTRKRTGNAVCDNRVPRIVSSLGSGAELHRRAEDIDEFPFSLQCPTVNISLGGGAELGILEGFYIYLISPLRANNDGCHGSL